ncbi:hypothetical protein [Phocaeicola sartorii]|nr:hypothetical protein [Phocaeicola sartorii]
MAAGLDAESIPAHYIILKNGEESLEVLKIISIFTHDFQECE